MLAAIRETVDFLMLPLREQLDRERERADRADGRADEERARADRLEQQLIVVETDLLTARADAAGLRCLLEQARPKPPRTRWQRLLRGRWGIFQ